MPRVLRIIVWNCMAATPALGRLCAANQSDDQTTYTIQDMSDVDCSYSWSNKTDNVLANEKQAIPELVLNYSLRALTTSRCLDVVHYEGTCGPMWEKQTANCTFNCVKKSAEAQETSIMLVAAVVIGVVFILAGLFYMFKKQKCIWKRSPMKEENAAAVPRTGQQDAYGLEPLPV